MYLDEWQMDSAIEVLRSFFEYLIDSELLTGADELLARLDLISCEFLYEMEDEANFSMRKTLITTAVNEGIDKNDHQAIIEHFRGVGHREMNDDDPEMVDAISSAIISFVIPFSDSRYITELNDVTGEDRTMILSILSGSLICDEQISPPDWDAVNVPKVIEESLIPYPMEKRRRNACIPIIHSFFTYLNDEHVLPQAGVIAESVLSLQEKMVTEGPAEELSKIELMLLHSILESGVDPEDEEAVNKHIERNMDYFMAELLENTSPELLEKLIDDENISSDIKEHQVRNPVEISSISKANREWFVSVSELTGRFCSERLDSEYAEICKCVAGKMARKKNTQIHRGKTNIWASGIIYAVGQLNFLFDKFFEPYQSADDICQYFETKKSTTSQKAKLIRDLIDMNDYWNLEYSTSRMVSHDPFKNIRLTKNGFII